MCVYRVSSGGRSREPTCPTPSPTTEPLCETARGLRKPATIAIMDDKTDKLYENKYGKFMGMYGSSANKNVCPDPIWKPVTIVTLCNIRMPARPSSCPPDHLPFLPPGCLVRLS